METNRTEALSLNTERSYQVSNQTAHLIKAYDLLTEVYTEIRAYLESEYSKEVVDKLYNRYIEVGYIELEAGIFALVQEAITLHRGQVGSNLI